MPFFRHDGELHYFAHIPKCGGQSIEAALAERFGSLAFLDNKHLMQPAPRRWTTTSPQHVAWADLVRIVPELWIASVFAVTRHPLVRVVSSYNFAARTGLVPNGLGIEEWFQRFASRRARHAFDHDNHLRPQIDFAPADAAAFRLEDGLHRVAGHLDDRFGRLPEPFAVPRLNAAPEAVDARRFRRQADFSPRFLRSVAAIYEADYDRYGYGLAPLAPAVATIPLHPGRNPLSRSRIRLLRDRVVHAISDARSLRGP